MISLRLAVCLLVCSVGVACISLSYPDDPDDPNDPKARDTANEWSTGAMTGARGADGSTIEPSLDWADLTRLARESTQSGDLEDAMERLAQASLQVAELAPSNAQRRTVFSLRARLAEAFAKRDELVAADLLADELIAEAEAEPELGDSALISLVLSVADRRGEDAELPLLRIALATSETGPPGRDRIQLSDHVAAVAFRHDDLILARRAIDQAENDARLISPGDKSGRAVREIFLARIALAQGDLEASARAAIAANQLFEEIEADFSSRGMAEAVLAEALARQGDLDRSLVVARGAQARVEGPEPVSDYAQRVILASLARVELLGGDPVAARRHFKQALAVPPTQLAADFDADRQLAERVRLDLQGFDAPDPSPFAPDGSE